MISILIIVFLERFVCQSVFTRQLCESVWNTSKSKWNRNLKDSNSNTNDWKMIERFCLWVEGKNEAAKLSVCISGCGTENELDCETGRQNTFKSFKQEIWARVTLTTGEMFL